MNKHLIFLTLLLSSFNTKSQEQDVSVGAKPMEVNCYETNVKLPERFTLMEREIIIHTWNHGCTYSSEPDEFSISASFIYIENDFSTEQFLSQFDEVEAKTIAKYHVLDKLSWTYQYGGMPDYFEEKIRKRIFLCYKDRDKVEGAVFSHKQCFSFIKGVLVQVGYKHSSVGKVSIIKLEESLSSVFR